MYLFVHLYFSNYSVDGELQTMRKSHSNELCTKAAAEDALAGDLENMKRHHVEAQARLLEIEADTHPQTHIQTGRCPPYFVRVCP